MNKKRKNRKMKRKTYIEQKFMTKESKNHQKNSLIQNYRKTFIVVDESNSLKGKKCN